MERTVIFEEFEFTMVNGLKYLSNEQLQNSDYLFINEANDKFSMYFEKDFPIFKVPENNNSNYCLFEIKKHDRTIKFFCPEKQKNLDTVVWYFYIKFINKEEIHILPGQIRVSFDNYDVLQAKGILKFIEVLDNVRIHNLTPVI